MKKKKNKLLIFQDDREPEMQMLVDSIDLGIEFIKTRLNEGDFQYKDIVIERKSINDFCKSILDGRFTKQQEKMKKFEKRFIVIVGNLNTRGGPINENSILGKITSLIIKHNIKVIQVEDEFQFLFVLKSIITKCIKCEQQEEKDENKKSN